MIERALARTFRNYSTIFLVVALVTLPVHMVYAFTFRNVIATSDFHDAIQEMPNYRQVRSVGPPQLDHARLAYWIVTVVELALVPLAVRATRRVFAVDEAGGVATVVDAWRRALQKQARAAFLGGWIAPVGVGIAGAVGIGLLLWGIGSAVTGFLSENWRWTGVGLYQALARAAAVPLALGPLALTRTKEGGSPAPKLY